MSNRNLRQHMADFYSDKSLSPEAVERLVSLAEVGRRGRTGRANRSYPSRWVYSVVGVAAGVAMTLFASPLFQTQDGATSSPIVENDPVGRPTLVRSPSKLSNHSARCAPSGCKGCDRVVSIGEGFCCGKGQCFGVPLTSKKLYAALVGHKIDAATVASYPCKDCPKARESKGACDHRKLVVGKTYQSPVSCALARGVPISDSLVAALPSKCERCGTALVKNGRCESCGAGFLAGRRYDEEEDYAAALVAFKTLAEASKFSSKCEGCAVAMVTDGTCEHCKVSFKDGIRIARGG